MSLGFEAALKWDTSVTGGRWTNYATMLAPETLFQSDSVFYFLAVTVLEMFVQCVAHGAGDPLPPPSFPDASPQAKSVRAPLSIFSIVYVFLIKLVSVNGAKIQPKEHIKGRKLSKKKKCLALIYSLYFCYHLNFVKTQV